MDAPKCPWYALVSYPDKTTWCQQFFQNISEYVRLPPNSIPAAAALHYKCNSFEFRKNHKQSNLYRLDMREKCPCVRVTEVKSSYSIIKVENWLSYSSFFPLLFGWSVFLITTWAAGTRWTRRGTGVRRAGVTITGRRWARRRIAARWWWARFPVKTKNVQITANHHLLKRVSEIILALLLILIPPQLCGRAQSLTEGLVSVPLNWS